LCKLTVSYENAESLPLGGFHPDGYSDFSMGSGMNVFGRSLSTNFHSSGDVDISTSV
jgi:hypothetical protein